MGKSIFNIAKNTTMLTTFGDGMVKINYEKSTSNIMSQERHTSTTTGVIHRNFIG
jgi:hypothetical protein